MKTLLRWIVVVLAMLSAFPAMAGKVGFLDAERAVASVQEGKRQLQALDAWAKPRRERVEQMRADLVELDKQLTAQRSVATAEVIKELESGLLQARREFEDAGRSFNRDLDTKQNEFLKDVATKIGTVASDYGRANDFDAIFMLNTQPLVYVRDSADVTTTVIRLYDERFPLN
jgi:Skp family chaperone for outer membrane proteins